MKEQDKPIPRCRMCNRPLKSKKSREAGMGSTCLKRYNQRFKVKKLIKKED